MNSLQQFGNSESRLHHFYIIEGATPDTAETLSLLLEKREGSDSDHITIFKYSTLGVEEAEELRARHVERASDGAAQFFLIFALSVTHEAQQALLKVFEEPRANTHFFLLMPEITAILPTVRSRAQYLRVNGEKTYAKEAHDFVGLSKEKRLAFIVTLVKSNEDNETSGELRLAASQFIAALIAEVRKDPKNLTEKKTFLEDALTMREYLDNRGASVKMILEHLALSL